MKNENLIHVKFGHYETLQSKRDILSLEMNLLKALRTIKKYHLLRSEELKTKLNLQKKIKEVVANMRKLQTTLPKLKIPEILKKDDEKVEKLDKIEEKVYYESLESQLQKIQDELNNLQG